MDVPQHIIQRGNNRQATFFAEQDYRGSSYRFHALGAPDPVVSTHEQYARLGRSADERQRAYRELFRTELDLSDSLKFETRPTVDGHWAANGSRTRSSAL